MSLSGIHMWALFTTDSDSYMNNKQMKAIVIEQD